VFTDVADEGQFERAVLLQHRARTSKVYVVDDDASVRRSLRRLLTARRFQVETFESAEAFLTCVDVSPNGCLLLDLQLLGMSGPELQSRLGDERRPLTVIAMSGSHNPRLEVEALRLGASAFLPKPFEAHALLEAIARASTSVRQ
jgi:FixJ family two-component response regulator